MSVATEKSGPERSLSWAAGTLKSWPGIPVRMLVTNVATAARMSPPAHQDRSAEAPAEQAGVRHLSSRVCSCATTASNPNLTLGHDAPFLPPATDNAAIDQTADVAPSIARLLRWHGLTD